jgi:hypothetical protein
VTKTPYTSALRPVKGPRSSALRVLIEGNFFVIKKEGKDAIEWASPIS